MKLLSLWCCLLGLLFSSAIYAQQPTEGWSNKAGWKYEVRDNPDGEKDLWLVPEDPSGARKLTSTGGWGNLRVHISPDDRTILVEDGGASLGIDLRVFKAGKAPLEFVEDETMKIADTVEAWAIAKAGGAAGDILGHRYVKAHGWSSDGSKVLVSIAGHEGELHIPGWFAIYDLATGELSFDLAVLNR
jgi:hypothetical protein